MINVMEQAARKAARGLNRDFGEVEHLQVSRKGPSDFVTAADMQAERVLLDELRKARPRYGFLMEEGGAKPGKDEHNRWIVDPLDGTTNFLHGIPHFAISIAQEQDGEIIAGVVYEPVRDEMFWAAKGLGAFLNRRRLRVSSREHLRDALIATGIPFRGKPKHPAYLDTVAKVMPEVAGIRRFGSAALDLAWLAAGRYDGFWEFGLEPWDIAAGLLLVREAGGRVTDVEGKDAMFANGSVLAANARLYDPLAKLVHAGMG
ncbi:MAG: inositol monophosphatase family protein [Bauldia litoralis]